ncbi:hypothetical protein MMC34_002052 [Xylographa carneopallida]|nr:hypothetical protein [Xylographa carneopallida]
MSSNNSLRHDCHAAYLEDYSEDTNATVPGTRQTANIAAKRSRPELRNKPINSTKGRDEASDSGYSSQTLATVASHGSSSQGSKIEDLSVGTALLQSTRKNISSGAQMAGGDRERSPEKPSLRRTLSRTQKNSDLRRGSFEGREAAARIRLSAIPVEGPSSSRNVPPERPQRLRHTGPPSPQVSRPPRIPEVQTIPLTRPPTARPRPSPSQGPRSRPASYHAGATSNGYYVQVQPPYVERPTEALYVDTGSYQPHPYYPHASTLLPTPLQSSPPRQPAYPFPHTTFAPPYQPPQPPPWSSSREMPSRRSSMYSAQVVAEYSLPLLYTADPYQQPQLFRRMSAHRSERPTPIMPLDEPFPLLEREEAIEQDEDYYRSMPPPPSRPLASRRPTLQRPTIRHAATTTSSHSNPRPRQPMYEREDPPYVISSRRQSIDEARPVSRPSATTRPSASSLKTSHHNRRTPETSPVDEIVPSRQTIVGRGRRPVSYHGSRGDPEFEAETYQDATSGAARPIPLTAEKIDQVVRHRSKAQASHGSGSDSRAGSSREGSDVKKSKTPSRSSMDRQRGAEKSDAGITISIANARQGSMTLDLKGGDIKDRTISFRQSQDRGGAVEVSIGQKSTVSSRDGRTRDRSVRRYSYAGSGKGVQEIGEADYSRRRSKSRAVEERVVERPRKEEEKGVEGDIVDKLTRLRTESRSRRSSRSVASRRGTEGQLF